MADIASAYINALIQHEEALRDLYQVFSEVLPAKNAKFWAKMSLEEDMHAEVMIGLAMKYEQGKVRFRRTAFRLEDILASVEWVKQAAISVRHHPITPTTAKKMALERERDRIEHSFFEVFAGDSPEICKDFEELHQHTEKHLRMIEKML